MEDPASPSGTTHYKQCYSLLSELLRNITWKIYIATGIHPYRTDIEITSVHLYTCASTNRHSF